MDNDNDLFRRDLSRFTCNQCSYCPNTQFKELQDFTRHLREKHCSVEGGSFVCRYGYNAVCNSLPVEGVSDVDYVKHIQRHHVLVDGNSHKPGGSGVMNRKLSTSSVQSSCSESSSQWSLYSANQNLAAVLNDPNRGKQKDFFTRTWGVDFVEKTAVDIPKHPYLPEINHSHFENYLKKISKRHKKHVHFADERPPASSSTSNEILQMFPKVRLQRCLVSERKTTEGPDLPAVFTQTEFDISNPDTFFTVFPFARDANTSMSHSFKQSGRLLQEKLTHELDLVEVLIAEQVAHKSEAFFQAMTSHDSLMEQLGRTLHVVRRLRERMTVIERSLVSHPLTLLQLEKRRQNHVQVLQKLRLMGTVQQTQPTIQILLSTPDYVTALDLISTSQELLHHELQGVQSFRYLGSQLSGITEMIDLMMNHEFINYSMRDLNRPLTDDAQVLEPEKLISIVLGMLKHDSKQLKFMSEYRKEVATRIQTVVKQAVLEALAEHDGDTEGQYTVDKAQVLDMEEWVRLLENMCSSLLRLLRRIKAVQNTMHETVSMAAGHPESSDGHATHTQSDDEDVLMFLTRDQYIKATQELRDMMVSVCDAAHEECARHISSLAKSRAWSSSTSSQVQALSRTIRTFTTECEKLSGKSSTPLRAAFQVVASEFVMRMQSEMKSELSAALAGECWRPAEVPAALQQFVHHVGSTGSVSKRVVETPHPVNSAEEALIVGAESYIVIGTVLLLIRMVGECSAVAQDLPGLALNILRSLSELLAEFNGESCRLVLGAGAVQTKVVTTITTTNLALCSRTLQVLLWLLPYIRKHFDGLLTAEKPAVKAQGARAVLSDVETNMRDHIKQLHSKVVLIVSSAVAAQVAAWGAKPPVPSQPFKEISRHLTKLHKAVAGVLPPSEVESLYRGIHRSFKDTLRDRLRKLNIVNNGGPQHGCVTSELTFYVEMLKKLQVLPAEDLQETALQDIWSTDKPH